MYWEPRIAGQLMPPNHRSLLGLVLSELVTVWRVRWMRRAVCLMAPLMLTGCVCFWWTVLHKLSTYHSCSDYNSQLFLDSLCDQYVYGKVTGSLCEPLCVSREIQFKRCLGHGVKLHVLEAEWNAHTIVLKAPKGLGSKRARAHLKSVGMKFDLTKENFIQNACATISSNVAGEKHPGASEAIMKLVEDILEECDYLHDGVLGNSEALTCWQLLETDEYVIYSLLQGREGIPDMYGVCGHMYAVQYAPSEPYIRPESSSDRQEWELRARLALGLLDMIESIEHTPFGTLYLCDVQKPNFGVVRREDRLVAKAIDVDISFFQSQLESMVRFEVNESCTKDSECKVINCEVPCDVATGKCSGKLVSNNLQLLCKMILRGQHYHHTPLLANPPKEIQLELDIILDKCATPGLVRTPQGVLKEFHALLQRSLHL